MAKVSKVQQEIRDVVAAGGHVLVMTRSRVTSSRRNTVSFAAKELYRLVGPDAKTVRKLTRYQVVMACKRKVLAFEASEIPSASLDRPDVTLKLHGMPA